MAPTTRSGDNQGETHVNRLPQDLHPMRTTEDRFRKQNPPKFDGLGNPMDAEKWVRAIEKIFNYIGCNDKERVACAIFQLEDEADFWWESVRRTITTEEWEDFTWEDFKHELYGKYIPDCYRQEKQNEFWNLKQGDGTVTEYDLSFNQLSRYATHLVSTDKERADKFRRGLRYEIAMCLASQGTMTYAQTLSRAFDIESLLPQKKKELAPPQQPSKGKRKHEDMNLEDVGKEKKQWDGNRYQPHVQPMPMCPRCQSRHTGNCKQGFDGCFKCGQVGHLSRQCPTIRGYAGAQPQRQNQRPFGNQRPNQRQPYQAWTYALNQAQRNEDQQDLEG